MQLYTKILFLISKNAYTFLTLSLYLNFLLFW